MGDKQNHHVSFSLFNETFGTYHRNILHDYEFTCPFFDTSKDI